MPLCPHCGTETNRKWSQYHGRSGQRWRCQGQGCGKTFLDPDARNDAKVEAIKLRMVKIRHPLLLLGLRLSCRQIETATRISWDSCRRTLFASFKLDPEFTMEFIAEIQAALGTVTSGHTHDLFADLAEWNEVHCQGKRVYSVAPIQDAKRITPARIRRLNQSTAGRKQVTQLLQDACRLTGPGLWFNERGELRWNGPDDRP